MEHKEKQKKTRGINKKDLIYFDKEYRIYKKGASQIGSFQFIDQFCLIDIGLNGLKEWQNCGLKHKKDLEAIFNRFKNKMDNMLKDFQEENLEREGVGKNA